MARAKKPAPPPPRELLQEARERLGELSKDGAPTPHDARRAAKRVRDAYKLDLDAAAGLLDEAAARGGRDDVLVGIYAVAAFKKKLSAERWPTIERWADAADEPVVADELADEIVAPLLGAAPELGERVARWAKSAEPLRRRLAGASARGLDDPARALNVLRPLAQEEDPAAQEGVLEGLRGVAERDPDALVAFLREERRMPAALRRDAAALLPAELALALATEGLPDAPRGRTGSRTSSRKGGKKEEAEDTKAAEEAREALERAQGAEEAARERVQRAEAAYERASAAAESAWSALERAREARREAREQVEEARRRLRAA